MALMIVCYFFRVWEKKKILLGRQTRQVIIEINIKPGSHVAIDDIRLEDCLPGNYKFLTNNKL